MWQEACPAISYRCAALTAFGSRAASEQPFGFKMGLQRATASFGKLTE
jgi:hypothetical protein